MPTTITRAVPAIVKIIGSRRFFYVIVLLLIIQALWIALTGRYPMAFDEDFHLGIIRIYANHLSPFLSHQPAGADAYGAVARDPSYLFQYLMSFPYRLVRLFTSSQTVQVLVLRFIDIALFASALPIYKRLLRRLGASEILANSCLLLFVLIPIAPLLAAQINYDNMLLPLVALNLLLAIKVNEQLSRATLSWIDVSQLIVLSLLTSIVKYAYLPIFAAVGLFLLYRYWRQRHTQKLSNSWRQLKLPNQLLVITCIVIAAGLFSQRYVINVVRYRALIPNCQQVLTIADCSHYGPWIRNYIDHQSEPVVARNPIIFSGHWFYGMWLRSFFAVDGPQTNFQTRGPMPVPALSSIVFGTFGLGLALIYSRRFSRQLQSPAIALVTLASVSYVIALWLDEFQSYVSTGQPVAINGRYLLLIYPVLLFIVARGASYLFKSQSSRLGLLLVATVCLLWGGGALTYILRSNSAWYWPSRPVYDANHAVQRVIGPITPGYHSPTEFLTSY